MDHCDCLPEALHFGLPVSRKLRLSVIVPAKDEADFILKTLDALRLQLDGSGNPVQFDVYEVLVLANNCNDQTFEICKQYQETHHLFNLGVECLFIKDPSKAHIGTVRRLLMDAAFNRLGKNGIIVSTDADSEVDPYWVYNIVSEIEDGADVVGGRIISRDTPALSKLQHLRNVKYRFLSARVESQLDPCPVNSWPRHFQCFGPSLAVTCEMYDRAGRLPAIPYLEDEEFRKALKRVDAIIRHSPKVKIFTSARLQGRVEFGFSVQLRKWGVMASNSQEEHVEAFDTLIYKYRIKSELRRQWNSGLTCEVKWDEKYAKKINISIDYLNSLRSGLKYFEAFWEEIENHLRVSHPSKFSLKPISEAIQELNNYFHHHNLSEKKNIQHGLARRCKIAEM